MNTFLRVLWQSWVGLARQASVWAGVALVVALTFVSVNALFGAQVLLEGIVRTAGERVDLTVSFRPSAPPAIVEQAKTYLLGLPQVAAVDLAPADRVLEAFRQRNQQEPAVLDALQEVGRNPFGARLTVQAKTLADYPAIAAVFQAPTYQPWVQNQSAQEQAAAIVELELLRRALRLGGSVLVLFFVCASLLLIIQAVRSALHAHRDEILIMRLVGARRTRIRAPFLLMAVWTVGLAWAGVMGGGWLAFRWLYPQTGGWLREGLGTLRAAAETQKLVFVVELAVAVAIAKLVAWIAAGKHIKR